jgi:hypothetical protein
MMGYLIGFVIGGIAFWCAAKLDCHHHRVKRRVVLEQQYVVLQKHATCAVAAMEEIINGSKDE